MLPDKLDRTSFISADSKGVCDYVLVRDVNSCLDLTSKVQVQIHHHLFKQDLLYLNTYLFVALVSATCIILQVKLLYKHCLKLYLSAVAATSSYAVDDRCIRQVFFLHFTPLAVTIVKNQHV